jgi:hypothetical protein
MLALKVRRRNMKTKDLIIISIIFLSAVVVTSEIVNFQLTGNHLFQRTSDNQIVASKLRCTQQPLIDRGSTADLQLKAVSEYEKACNSSFLDSAMIFTNMPISVPNAQAAADKMTPRLQEFKEHNISPMVIAEPDSDWGLIDFEEFAQGNYDEWTKAYFLKLKENGITDEMLGLWIPFPEPQQDVWNNSTSDNFAHSVNRYFTIMRGVFPSAKTGILLDSQVGEGNNKTQLLAYTRLVDNSLVNVAGLQGFPWYPIEEGDERSPIVLASQFAPAALVDEMAKSLGTKEVLINTGSFRHRKASNGGDIAVTTSDRTKTLKSISHEVSELRKKNYDVKVNIFTENKLDTKEGVDWSYWQAGKFNESEHTALFTTFIRDIDNTKSKVSIFDARE